MVNRRASHAGSWYDNDRRKLSSQLENWLDKAEYKHEAKAVIVPHAGYYYRYEIGPYITYILLYWVCRKIINYFVKRRASYHFKA